MKQDMSDSLIEVAVSGPLKRTFAYLADDPDQLQPGQRLLVPFGRRRRLGFYVGTAEFQPGLDYRRIIKPLDQTSQFSRELYEFCMWAARYYFANPADVLSAALPSALRGRRGAGYRWGDKEHLGDRELAPGVHPGKLVSGDILASMRREGILEGLIDNQAIVEHWPTAAQSNAGRGRGYRVADLDLWYRFCEKGEFRPKPFDGVRSRKSLLAAGWNDYQIGKARKAGILEPVATESGDVLSFIPPREGIKDIELNDEQSVALQRVVEVLDDGFAPFLLHGVTGSGKTIVYCHICREVLARNRTVLVLTPEIALTGATLSYFRGMFGDRVTVIHSAMTERERIRSWRGIRRGDYSIVVGPRSAVFAPLENIGAVIVDEEHDPSYKQDDPAPRLHARDAAVMRAKLAKVPVVLGSASPSLESYYNAESGRYRLLRLTQRPAAARLPEVRVVDMRTDRLRGDLPYLSYTVKKEIDRCLTDNRQAILFLNRRGHSPQLKCAACGKAPECPSCRVKLTYHKVGRKLACHYCGHVQPAFETCPGCGSHEVFFLGAGTQKVEESLPRLFREARAVRMDGDTASGRRRAHQILTSFAEHRYDVLLGTQMVAKGLDFPLVTLVGILAADLSLDLPDFRASEHAFARLLQVAGRSGRATDPGQVLIQTYYPDSRVIAAVKRHDYESFYNSEIASRKALGFPPFSRLLLIGLSDKDEKKLKRATDDLRAKLARSVQSLDTNVEILGPAPSPLYFLRGRYRRQLLLKTAAMPRLVHNLTAWEESEARFGLPASVRVSINVDPIDVM